MTSTSTPGGGGDVQPEKMSSHGTGGTGRGRGGSSLAKTWMRKDGEASPEDHPLLSQECGVWAASQCSGDKGDPPGQDKHS